MKPSLQYLIIIFLSALVVAILVFCINLFFDPLWYHEGNQLEELNYMFNERLSKTNQYLKRQPTTSFNCFIFGSSRTTLLNESLLDEPYHCFNFSFSGGRIQEFVAYAKWLKHRGEDPKYIILGIDDFNFVELDTEINIPDFIKHHTNPPSIFFNYFSIDALDMSFRLFVHSENDPKIYNGQFLGVVIPNPPRYHPKIFSTPHTMRKGAIGDYQELRMIYPTSVFIGYIPPISSWITASKSQEELNFFLNSVYTMSSFFHVLYDFSIPSEVTNNPENTYDGSHYFPYIQNAIVKSINNEPMAFGIQVNNIPREDYIDAYKIELSKFRASLDDK